MEAAETGVSAMLRRETSACEITLAEPSSYGWQSQSLTVLPNAPMPQAMTRKRRNVGLPREVISLTTYAQLDLYLAKFAAGELGLVLLLGRHGTGKSESVKRVLGIATTMQRGHRATAQPVLYIEGHMQPFGLYRHLWEHRDRPVVLDDLDKLYADANCVRLLKPLCNTEHAKRITWLTNLTLNDPVVPTSFTTTSSVVLIANEWRTANPNVRALEDRAIILHFDPSNAEVHRRVGEWFQDPEVYRLIGETMPAISAISMRHYCKGAQLRRAGLADWRISLLQMILPDPRLACVAALQHDSSLRSEEQRARRFVTTTGSSRATYFRMKAKFALGPIP
jgi:energy-coupling factor transporter ATP-binding protein EcfA2